MMKIQINGVSIDFQLEHEKTAGEVFAGVSAWLHESGHRITSITLNGASVSESDTQWRDTPVEKVETLDVDAVSVRERQVNDFETIISYTDLLRRVMDEGDASQREAVLEELPHVLQGIERNAPDLKGLLEEPLADASHHDAAVRAAVARRCEELTRIFDLRQRELLYPEQEMAHTLTALESVLPTFEEIPAEIQGGDRKGALDTITRFSELVAKELRILPVLMTVKPELQTETVDDSPIHESIHELNKLFLELEEAFTHNDLVLIGDILEYEMLPRFRAFNDVVQRHLLTEKSDTSR